MKNKCIEAPFYTGSDERLHGQKLPRFHLALTREQRNWTNVWRAKAPFTRVQTNFYTDEFCSLSWTASLHGSVQVLLHIAVVFTWFRANFFRPVIFALLFQFCATRPKHSTAQTQDNRNIGHCRPSLKTKKSIAENTAQYSAINSTAQKQHSTSQSQHLKNSTVQHKHCTTQTQHSRAQIQHSRNTSQHRQYWRAQTFRADLTHLSRILYAVFRAESYA